MFHCHHHCFHCLTAHALFFTAVSRATKGYGQAHKRSGSFAAETSLSLARSYDERALKLALGSTGEFIAGLHAFVFVIYLVKSVDYVFGFPSLRFLHHFFVNKYDD